MGKVTNNPGAVTPQSGGKPAEDKPAPKAPTKNPAKPTDQAKRSQDILAIANLSKKQAEDAIKKDPTSFIRDSDHIDKESRLGNQHDKRGTDKAISDLLLKGTEIKPGQGGGRGGWSSNIVQDKTKKLEEVAAARAQALKAGADGSVAGRDSKNNKERKDLDQTLNKLSGVQLATTAEQLHQDATDLRQRYDQLREIANERVEQGKKLSTFEQQEALLTYEQWRGTLSAEKATLLVIQEKADEAGEDVHDFTLRGLNQSLDGNKGGRDNISTGIHGAENDGKDDDIKIRRESIANQYAAIDHGHINDDGQYVNGIATILSASTAEGVTNLEGAQLEFEGGRTITIDNADFLKRANTLTTKTYDMANNTNAKGMAVIDYLQHTNGNDATDAVGNLVNLDQADQGAIYNYWTKSLPAEQRADVDAKVDTDQDGYPDAPDVNPTYVNLIEFGQKYQMMADEERKNVIRFFEAVKRDPEGTKRYFDEIERRKAEAEAAAASAQEVDPAAEVPADLPVSDGSVPTDGGDVAVDPNAYDTSGPQEDGSTE